MKTYWMPTMLTLALGFSGPALADQPARRGNDPAMMLQTAMHMDQVEGRMPEAIAAYRKVLAEAGTNRVVAAQAWLRLAMAYEKLGRPEARATYERVLREFNDQPKVSAAARTRLARVGGAVRRQVDLAPRRVSDGTFATVRDVSADGRIAVGTERTGYSRFDLVLHDLVTGRASVLMKGSTGQHSFWHQVSDDGRQVAYTWVEDERPRALRVTATAPGAVPRTYEVGANAAMLPFDWAPDGSRLLVMLHRWNLPAGRADSWEIAWLSLASGEVKVIKALDWHVLHRVARVSPDGRYIAFTAEPRAGSADRYLFVMDADGRNEHAVVASAGARFNPMWTPDGGHIVYVDALFNEPGLWAVPVRDGQAGGEPVLLRRSLEGVPLGVTGDGTLLYQPPPSSGGGNRVYLADRRPASSDRVTVLEGLGVSWSRDGRQLAMMRQTSGQTDMTLVVRDLATGQERSYHTPGLAMYTPQWLPGDTHVVVVVGEPHGGRTVRACHRLDLATGTFTRLFPRDTPTHTRTNNGVLSLDGRLLYLGRSEGEAQPVRDIVAVDLASGVERHVASLSGAGGGPVAGLALSPDGRTLAVTTWVREYESAALSTIALDGGSVRSVVPAFDTGWLADDLRWGPDGQSLVFTAFDGRSQWRLLRVPATGGAPEPDGLDYDTLTPLLGEVRMFPGNFNNFDLSPDGVRVAASTLTWSKQEVWALDVAALMASK